MNRLLRFAMVGVANTLIDFALYLALTSYPAINPAIANVLSYTCGIIVSFTGNSYYTFGLKQSTLNTVMVRFAYFYGANVSGLLFGSALISVFSIWANAIVAKALSLPLTIIFNFHLARRVLASPSQNNAVPHAGPEAII